MEPQDAALIQALTDELTGWIPFPEAAAHAGLTENTLRVRLWRATHRDGKPPCRRRHGEIHLGDWTRFLAGGAK